MADEIAETDGSPEDGKDSDASSNPIIDFIGDWGFAFLVAVVALGAGFLAWKVTVPHPVPAVALDAESVYRVEVGGAAFIALYIVVLFLVLALNGEGPRQLGTGGFKTGRIVRQTNQAVRDQDQSIRKAELGISELKLGLQAAKLVLEAQQVALKEQQKMIEGQKEVEPSLGRAVEGMDGRIKILEKAGEQP